MPCAEAHPAGRGTWPGVAWLEMKQAQSVASAGPNPGARRRHGPIRPSSRSTRDLRLDRPARHRRQAGGAHRRRRDPLEPERPNRSSTRPKPSAPSERTTWRHRQRKAGRSERSTARRTRSAHPCATIIAAAPRQTIRTTGTRMPAASMIATQAKRPGIGPLYRLADRYRRADRHVQDTGSFAAYCARPQRGRGASRLPPLGEGRPTPALRSSTADRQREGRPWGPQQSRPVSEQEIPLRHRQHLGGLAGQKLAVGADLVGLGIDLDLGRQRR